MAPFQYDVTINKYNLTLVPESCCDCWWFFLYVLWGCTCEKK